MNQKSHNSLATVFKIYVVKSEVPKARINLMQDDIEVYLNDWFEFTIPLNAFDFKRKNYNLTY